MIVHDVKQGSREWFELRVGMPTASRFSRILTPAKLQLSKGAQAFVAELLAERVLGKPLDDTELDTIWTARGNDTEAEARRWYEFIKDVEVEQVGFVTDDAVTVGCSPDGLVGVDGGIEIKCRSAKNHMSILLGDPIADPLQVQGNLWVTGREWWDVIAYNPVLPKKIQRVEPDPVYFGAFEEAFPKFFAGLARAEAIYAAIDGDYVDASDLMLQLTASLVQGVDADPDALDLDEIDAFSSDVRWAQAEGLLNAEDAKAILDDATNGQWKSVRSMMAYITRHKELRAV